MNLTIFISFVIFRKINDIWERMFLLRIFYIKSKEVFKQNA